MNALWVIALNGFREARRNRVSTVVFAFAFVLIFVTTVSIEVTVATFDRMMTDLGLGVMGLISATLTIFIGTALIPREIERRTIFLVVSKPISRSTFIVGRYLGNLLAVWFVLAVMSILFLAQIAWNGRTLGTGIHPEHLVAIVGLFLESILLTAVCFLLASGLSQFVASVCAVGVYLIGHMAEDLYRLAQRTQVSALKMTGQALYYVLPNFDRLDWKARATYFDPTSTAEVVGSAAYTLAFTGLLLIVACAIFERRDFK